MQKMNIAIDLGAYETTIYIQGVDLVLREATAIAYEEDKIIAVGNDCRKLEGKEGEAIVVKYPVNAGLVEDVNDAAIILKHFLSKIVDCEVKYAVISAVFAVPMYINEDEREKLAYVAYAAGISQVGFIPKATLIPSGFGFDGKQGKSYLTVDIGGSHTEIAVVNGNTITMGHTIIVGGELATERIIEIVQKTYKLRIGFNLAEKAKLAIGSLYDGDISNMEIAGVEIGTNIPRLEVIEASDIKKAVDAVYATIVNEINKFLNKVGEDCLSDIDDTGILLCGNASKILGLGSLLATNTKLDVKESDVPGNVVICGAGAYLNTIEDSKKESKNKK